MLRWALFVAALRLLASCGNGSDKAAFRPFDEYAAKCASPRSGSDPTTGMPFPDRQGTLADEKAWLRSWINELYLWYREVPSVDPASYYTAVDYFGVLKTSALTASGKPKDRFHFTLPTATWTARSQSGVQIGYGVQWDLVEPFPPRRMLVAYNEPGSPAANASIGRGAQVLAVDGVDLVYGTDAATLNAGLNPATANESHSFSILDRGAQSPRTVTLVSANIESSPVQNVRVLTTPTGTVGYMLFNDHLATAEAALIAAVNQLKSAGITDLVLDIRYNEGGYLRIASELAYMIAGPTATTGKTFERDVFNDKYPTSDPFTGLPITPMTFYDTAFGFSATPGQPLPYLGLSRVFVITGSGTCSASESVINSLRGIDIQVILVGSTTCGKPYGFWPTDNCGTTYFSIQIKGVNAKDFGDYTDGFTPGGTGGAGAPGCSVADDFTRDLGDPAEARLAAALRYRVNQSCAPGSSARALMETETELPATDGYLMRAPWSENRIYTR